MLLSCLIKLIQHIRYIMKIKKQQKEVPLDGKISFNQMKKKLSVVIYYYFKPNKYSRIIVPWRYGFTQVYSVIALLFKEMLF